MARELIATGPAPVPSARWDLRSSLAVAVTLVVGLTLNWLAIRWDDAQQSAALRPTPPAPCNYGDRGTGRTYGRRAVRRTGPHSAGHGLAVPAARQRADCLPFSLPNPPTHPF